MFTSFDNITEAVNTAFFFILAVSVVLLVSITVLMVGFVVRYRRKRHPKAGGVEGNAWLEVAWTIVPTILVLGMFYYGWIGYKLMRTPPGDALEVTAVAQMWSWQFRYENGKQSAELRVPSDRPVKVLLESRDVLHSFYAPAFLVKQDVVPGIPNFVWFQPYETGTYDIFCAEYCGQRHSYMLSKVVVVDPAEFEQWVAEGVDEAIPEASGDEDEAARMARLARVGKQLGKIKGCEACHTADGTAMVGPSYKGLFGKTETVVTNGETRQVLVDEEYIRRSILDPQADLVEGFPPVMPSQEGLMTDEEIEAIIEYLKTLR